MEKMMLEQIAERFAADLDDMSRMGGIVDKAFLAGQVGGLLIGVRAAALEEAAKYIQAKPTINALNWAEGIRALAAPCHRPAECEPGCPVCASIQEDREAEFGAPKERP